MDQPPDISVFDKLDEVPSDLQKEASLPTITPVYMKIEARSPSSCDSEFSYSSASPPHSPSISEAGSNAYSTDEGIVEDISDLEGEADFKKVFLGKQNAFVTDLADLLQLCTVLINFLFYFNLQNS